MKLAITEQAAEQKPDNDSADVRNALIKRLGVAGVLVALLLGVLALFDRLASPPEEPPARRPAGRASSTSPK